jgi:hypothetical protein
MTTTASTAPRRIPQAGAIAIGVVGGIVGGILFGVMMAAQGMLPMVAALIGSDAAAVGFVVHLAISAGAGLVFGAAVAAMPAIVSSPVIAGVVGGVYGVVWWVAGALIAMPLLLGMSEMVLVIGDMQIDSLIGHLVFGVATGLVVHALMRSRGLITAGRPRRS